MIVPGWLSAATEPAVTPRSVNWPMAPGQHADLAGQPDQRRARQVRQRPDQQRGQRQDPDEAAGRPGRGERASAACVDPDQQGGGSGRDQCQTGREAPVPEPGRLGGRVAHRLDRGDPGCPPGRCQRGDHGDGDTGHDREDEVSDGQLQAADRQRQAERAEQRAQCSGHQQAEPGASNAGHRGDDRGLGEYRAECLAGAGAERPGQGEFAGALANQDRERIPDHERADDQRDPGKAEEEALQGSELAVDLLGCGGRRGSGGYGPGGGREYGRDAVPELGR